jgi:DNA invertase Pin-like site-specific DNA recombinase
MPGKQAFPKTKSHRVFGHPLRVGFYARVSTHDQQTLPLQLHAMRDYAAKRGWTIAAQIKEVGSGASQRELRTTLIAAARRRQIDVVLVWRLDRWGRSVADLVSTLQELPHLGVGLNGKRLGRPPTVVHKAIETRNLYRQGIGKSEIARRLRIGRTSVRRLLAQKKS